jgi:Zc3h12a-like Ribonuclease NYN domain/S1 RNA binding domain
MPPRHVVVDGSNLATEGRSMPSLGQLDQAVREFVAENPQDVVTVIVDASFGHRIDPSEMATFEEAEAAGEVISPPAGAIGRGDAFLLRIAEKIGATVLSNDSFQEFHGDHSWLFDKGRLVGGKPVPGVGWIFMDRSPVRGQKSREVVKEAKRRKKDEPVAPVSAGVPVKVAAKAAGKAAGKAVGKAAGVAKASTTGLDLVATRAKGRPKSVARAIATATQEVVEPKVSGKSRRRRGGEPPAEPVNEPLTFITFIAAHPLGTEVVGTAVQYSSHGAFVEADGARCYVPLSAMGEPPPRRAREVIAKGEALKFVIQAFDPPRRGIELALPGFAHVAGSPTPETVEAEIHHEEADRPRKKRSGKAGAEQVREKQAPPTEARVGKKRAASGSPASSEPKPRALDGAATRAPGRIAAPSSEGAAATKAAAKKGVPKKAAVKKAASPKKAPAVAKAVRPRAPQAVKVARAAKAAKAAPAKAAPAPAPAKKAASKRAGASKSAPPGAKKAAGAKKAEPAAAVVAARKAGGAKKSP